MNDLQDRAGSSVNDTGTCVKIDTPLTQPRSPAVPDPAAIKTHLVRLRRARGYDTPVGHRCSNILEMLDCLPPEDCGQRTRLLHNISIQAAELDAELSKLKALAN